MIELLFMVAYIAIIVGCFMFISSKVKKELNVGKYGQLPVWVSICILISAISMPGVFINIVSGMAWLVSILIGAMS